MVNYKFKIEYSTYGSMGVMKEQKFTDYTEMINAIGFASMISWNVYVYYKVNGKWEHTRTIECHKC